MAKIWRIQREDGSGPYHGVSSDNWVESYHDMKRGCPCPSEDLLLKDYWTGLSWEQKKEWRFGFISEESLKQWFTELELQRLFEIGYSIVILEVGEIKIGSHQVMFRSPNPQQQAKMLNQTLFEGADSEVVYFNDEIPF